MNAPFQKTSELRDDCAVTATVVSASHTSLDNSESTTLLGDQYERSLNQQDSPAKNSTKKVKIVDPGPSHDPDSDEEDSLSHPGGLERPNAISTGENVISSVGGQLSDPQAAAADRKKTREERKKEREKKKEEEMLKKYQAEQEAKQKISAKSKCGRWIKHNLKLGKGGYKFVYRGYDTVEAKNVAWCEFKREHVDTKEKRQAMFRETEIMLKMNHPHIVRCFDVFREWIDMDDPNNPIEEKGVVIIQELMEGGTLKSAIRKNFLEGHCILRFSLITRWWHQILDALRYMHHRIQPPILHRDLKADNCFLYGAADGECLNVKVGDFGLATHVNNSGRKTMLGTLGFMAPEIFDENYDEKVDIYAFGMLMLEVMTNRTPYDECETVMQVAAKTMSGHGPEIMDKILNPSLREVISACIHPLTCFRPTAEELYFHPLFQRYQGGDDSWPKTLPVEVEPNYDNATDRAEVLDRFVRSLEQPETRNPNFNLRLRFRDKKMLQELGLDDGESLEFDLDIYKAEDQDIPDLIHNLRLGYEDKLWRVFENPKQPDKKIVSSHLDKLFSSIRLQMQFLVKVLLGKRWKAILDSLIEELRIKKKQELSSAVDEADDSDADGQETSSFTLIGKYKARWGRAKRMLEREIQAYRNATSTVSSMANAAIPTPVLPTSGGAGSSPAATSSQPMGSTPEIAPITPLGASHVTYTSQVSNVPVGSSDGFEPSAASTAVVTTVGKFIISTPASPSVAPVTGLQLQSLSTQTESPHDNSPKQTSEPPPQTTNSTASQSIPVSQACNSLALNDIPVPSIHQPLDISSAQPVAHSLAPTTAPIPVGSFPIFSQPMNYSQGSANQHFNPEVHPIPTNVPDVDLATNLDNATRSVLLLQQLLQSLAPKIGDSAHTDVVTRQIHSQLVGGPISQPTAVYSTGQYSAPQSQTSLTSQQQLVLAAAAAAAAAEQSGSIATTAVSSDAGGQPPFSTFVRQPSYAAPMPTQTGVPNIAVSDLPQQLNILSSLSNQLHRITSEELPAQSNASPMTSNEPPFPDPISATQLINQLTEALLNAAASASPGITIPSSPAGGSQPPRQKSIPQSAASVSNFSPGSQSALPTAGSVVATAPQTIYSSQPTQFASATSSKQLERKPRKKSKLKPRYILRVTKLDRDPEGSEQGTLRPTFYLEMPDPENPNSELWKLSFRCNLSDTPDDIKLFHGHTQVNQDVVCAAKLVIIQLLEAMRADVNSVKLNQDYVFYPCPFVQSGPLPPIDASALGNQLINGLQQHLSTIQSSHSSLGASSLVSRSLVGQTGITPTELAGLSQPAPNILMSYETSAATQNLEEVLPVDQSVNPNFLTGLSHAEDPSQPKVPMSAFSSIADTAPDEGDEEASDVSRPFSPSDPQMLSSQPLLTYGSSLDPVYFPKPASIGSLTPYFSASSCSTGGQSTQRLHTTSQPVTLSQVDPSASRMSPFSLGVQYIKELLASLTGKSPEYLQSYVNEYQPGLEEVVPLAPSAINQSVVTSVPSYDSSSQAELLNAPEPVAFNRGDSQPNNNPPDCSVPPVHHVAPFSSVAQQSAVYHSHPCAMVNLTCTIPATLESVFRELIFRLCTSPFLPHVVLPTSTRMADGSPGAPSLRVVEIPEGHIFLGSGMSGSFGLTTFNLPDEPAFILLGDPHAPTSDRSTRIFRIPTDSAVVLCANGSVYCLDKAALVVPVQSSETQRSISPSGSPVSDLVDGARHKQHATSSVHVRELPFQPNMDTLTLDDVLHLLLALRSTSQQPRRSTTTSPTSEVPFMPSISSATDYYPLTAAVPRRVSGHATQQGAHLSQLQQLSLGNQHRSLLSHLQMSQPLASGLPFQPEQPHAAPRQPQSFRPPQSAIQNIDSLTSFTGLPQKDWYPDPSSCTQSSAYGGQTGTANLTNIQPSPPGQFSNQSGIISGVPYPYQNAQYQQRQPHPVPTLLPPSDPSCISPATLQLAVQLLSALNLPATNDQLSSLLCQIVRTPSTMQPMPSAFTTDVANTHRYSSVSVNPPQQTNVRPLMQQVISRNDIVTPPDHLAANRPLGPQAFFAADPNADLANICSPALGPIRPAVALPVQGSFGASSVIPVTLAHGVRGPSATIIQQKKSFSQLSADPLINQQPAQQSVSGQTGMQQVHPELLNLLRFLQRQSEPNFSRDLWNNIPSDLQNRLLSIIQAQSGNVSSGEAPVAPQHSLGSCTQPLLTMASHTVPSPPKGGAGSCVLSYPSHPSSVPTSTLPLPLGGVSVPVASVGASGRDSGTQPKESELPKPQSMDSHFSSQPSTSPTCFTTPAVPITVANKFTVVPVQSENEEPLGPVTVSDTFQVPPRPPRLRPNVSQPATPPVVATTISSELPSFPGVSQSGVAATSTLRATSQSSFTPITASSVAVACSCVQSSVPAKPQPEDSQIVSSQVGSAKVSTAKTVMESKTLISEPQSTTAVLLGQSSAVTLSTNGLPITAPPSVTPAVTSHQSTH